MANAKERWEKATSHLSGLDASTKARDFVNRHTAYRTAFKAAATDLELGLYLDTAKSKLTKQQKSKM